MAELLIKDERVINVTLSKEKTIKTSISETKGISTNVEDLNYIPAYREYEKERQENEIERQEYYEDIQNKVNNGEFNGKDGEVGKSIEYDWEGTKLGIRQEGQKEFEYVDLKGENELRAGENIEIKNNVISVLTAPNVEQDNTKPITSGAVYTEVGNINILLQTI